MQPLSAGERKPHSSAPEDRFVELVAQVFGFDKVQLLAPQFPVEDIEECPRILQLREQGLHRAADADISMKAERIED